MKRNFQDDNDDCEVESCQFKFRYDAIYVMTGRKERREAYKEGEKV
jgi:hypothetical protein